MKKEVIAATVQTSPAVIGDIWLWLTNHELAWFVSLLTIIYIMSQLFWGWTKFLRREREG